MFLMVTILSHLSFVSLISILVNSWISLLFIFKFKFKPLKFSCYKACFEKLKIKLLVWFILVSFTFNNNCLLVEKDLMPSLSGWLYLQIEIFLNILKIDQINKATIAKIKMIKSWIIIWSKRKNIIRRAKHV
jgi:hypothetical protein